MLIPTTVTVREVGPRDGLQNEAIVLPIEKKIALVDALSATGLKRIEVTSFVSPRAVPQMADATAVMQGIKRHNGIIYSAIVPNLKGAQGAIAAGAEEIQLFLSASETHNLKNVGMSVARSLIAAGEIATIVRAAGLPVEAVIATSFGCPYEGDIPVERVVDLAAQLLVAGIERLSFGDTTGMATPLQVQHLVGILRERFSGTPLNLHFHNTRGTGLANVFAALQMGIDSFDASIGGLGGCPFAPGATGNICTEDLVYMLHEMGIATGIDLDALIACAHLAQDFLGRELPGQVMKAGKRSDLARI